MTAFMMKVEMGAFMFIFLAVLTTLAEEWPRISKHKDDFATMQKSGSLDSTERKSNFIVSRIRNRREATWQKDLQSSMLGIHMPAAGLNVFNNNGEKCWGITDCRFELYRKLDLRKYFLMKSIQSS
jgi:hypothetical protein